MFTTPIVSQDTQSQIDRAIAQYKDAAKWREWGLSTLRPQGPCILLEGPPGTGKTTIAEFIAIKIRKKGIKIIDFAEFGSQVPGENSRQIKRLFAEANKNGGMTIFMDEVEAILWSRDRVAGSNTWMLEVIDTILAEISKYKHLIILATNRADMLDAAIMRRLIARIYVGLPDQMTRLRLWKAKWPEKFPLRPTPTHLDKLSLDTEGMTGNTIERIIMNAGARAIVEQRLPAFSDFVEEVLVEKALLLKNVTSHA